jgi:PAS domain S-box-containing protein
MTLDDSAHARLVADNERLRAELEQQIARNDQSAVDRDRWRQAEAELLRERDFSNALLDALPGVFYVLDTDGRFHRWNENFSKVTGYSDEEFAAMNALELFAGTDKELIAERIGRAFEHGEATAEAKINTKDGRTVPFLFTGVRIVMDGEPRLIGMGIDITAQRRAGEELATIFKMSSDMICIADLNKGTFERVNPAFSEILGYEEAEILGAEYLSFNHPDDVEPTNKVVEEQLKRGETVLNFENRYRCKDGTYKWLEWVAAPDADKGLTFSIARDVTQRKRDEATLEDLNERLARSNEELEQFAYVASHDLQEPLRMVASYTQLLAQRYQGQLDTKADQFIGYAVDGARRMQGLINDLLVLSRIGTSGLSLKPTDCGEVITEVLQSLQSCIDEACAKITIGEMPTVMADQTQLEQVFQNLLSNAIKFHGEEAPRIEVSATRQGARWDLCVTDNGIGIDPKYFDRIFSIFQRLHELGAYPGSGIGLSIVKKIVERHGGQIHLDSAPGEGSRFSFTLSAVGGSED